MRKVCTTLLCALVGYAAGLGAQENPDVRFAASDAGGRMSFTGDDIRIGIGIDDDGDAHGEYFHVFGEQETSAWIAEGWVADDRGGIKLNFHFLTGAESLTEAATSDDVHVTKFFVAADRNEFDDRKITAGLGMESERLFWGAYLMRRITGRRLIDTTIDQTIDVSNFTDMGQVFEQQTITDDITRLYERAYDFGVGGRIGHFYEDSLIRVRGGLDYETGRFGADQYTLSLGLEKYFANTGHSLALTAEYLDKSGDFEVDSSDTRALLFYRYSFGERYQPRRDALETRTMSAPPMREVTRIEKRPVRNRIEISEEAYFGFDSAAVGGEARQDLEALAARIASTEIVDRVTITGHTCDLGPAAYNQGLSERRAASARDFLAAAGLDDTLLVTRGRGESNPRYPNDGEDNRRLNRRVEIEFVSLEAGFEDVEVTVEEPDGDGVRWTRQAIDDPAWIDRALRNPVAHKRIVDTYRFAETERVVTENEPFVVNNLPVASDDASTTRREMPVTIAVLANDSDPDGGPLRVVSVTAPASGTATVEGGAMVTYAPNPGFAGIDSFSYLIVDDFGSEASAEVVVTVEDFPPIVIGDDQAMTRTGVPVVIDVLANDSGEGLFLGSAGAPSNGTTSIVDGAIRYAPAAGFVGTDSFTYEVGDANGQEGSGTVTVTVTPPPITATDDMAQTLRNRDVVIDVLRNDEGEMLELAAVEMPANGTATIEDGRVRFEPRRDFTGTDSFRYTVTDAGGETAQATVTVVVMPFNTTPVANDDAAVTDKNVAVVIDVLANDSDEDGDTLTIVSVDPQQTGFGTVAITADQQIRYTPNPGWWGGDSFTYTIDDGFGGQATASVVLDVRE